MIIIIIITIIIIIIITGRRGKAMLIGLKTLA
jgi:hypothetical protein